MTRTRGTAAASADEAARPADESRDLGDLRARSEKSEAKAGADRTALLNAAVEQAMASTEWGRLSKVAREAGITAQYLRDIINKRHPGWLDKASEQRNEGKPQAAVLDVKQLRELRTRSEKSGAKARKDRAELLDAAVEQAMASTEWGHLSGAARDAGINAQYLRDIINKRHPGWLDKASEQREQARGSDA